MSSIRNISKTFMELIKVNSGIELTGFLGDLQHIVTADNNHNVYVTLEGSSGVVITVYNNRVPNIPTLPVVVGWDGGVFQVLRSREVFIASPYPAIPTHANTHTFPAYDTIPIRGEQFIPGLVEPAGGLTVRIYGKAFWLDGFHITPTRTYDLTSSLPGSGALYAVLELDDTGAITVNSGSPVDSAGLLTPEDIPTPSTDKHPIPWAIALYVGDTEIIHADLVDLRWSGYGSGGGGAVDSVNGMTGVVVLDYSDVGADTAGAAATAESNAKAYADGLMTGLWDDRGSFDASGGSYPSSGGSGTAGAILKGDIWTISVAGTLPTGQVVEIGDTVRALIDTPGNTQANWAIQQNNIGYTAENSANKATTMSGNETSNVLYLTAKAIYDWAVGLFVALTGDQTIAGVKTFSSFPVTPSSAPTANYQTANKKYVDDKGRYLPMGVYLALNPLSATGTPYAGTLNGTATMVKFSIAFYITAPNNASNYWEFKLATWSTDLQLATVDSSGLSAGYNKLSTTTFSNSPTSEPGVYMQCVKHGSPGSLYVSGPMIQIID